MKHIVKIKRSESVFIPKMTDDVIVKSTGAITEIKTLLKTVTDCPIVKFDADNYILKSTGELLPFKKTTMRIESPISVKQTLHRLRDIINTNCEKVSRCKWLTLTYAENMTDRKRLYEDFRRFHQRFLYHCKTQYNATYEYIVCCEPQGRGAWHMHLILIFNKKAPFIRNDTIAEIWGHGYTKTKRLDNVDNVGLYLTAYLADMEFENAIQYGITRIRINSIQEKDGKAFVKGSRLRLYPRGFRIYRASKGVKQPSIGFMTESDAQALVRGQKLTYEKTVDITGEDGSIINRINYRQYNRGGKK